MSGARVERRLAAILAVDVAGYSRLMGEDEEGTLAALRAIRRELGDPKIKEHRGRIVKTTGDGLLVEFASVVDAVRCAVEVQREMATRNVGIPPQRRIEFRMGINLGDIIVEDGDIFGDGVNIAARLEALADPGGICVSRVVRDQVRDKLDFSFEDLGEQQVKNIARPVRIHRIDLGSTDEMPSDDVPDSVAIPPPRPAPRKPSIAVLPLANMSGDPEQEYFSEGVTEDIITNLSRNRAFFVISRSTSFTYKGPAVDIAKVARELSVRYVLEGSVRRAGNRVRITAQLIDAETGHHLWADRYDRELADVFAVQDEIAQNIVGAIAPGIISAEIRHAQHKDPSQLDAWDRVMRAHWHIRRFTQSDLAEARRLLEEAIALDPTNSMAFADLAFARHFEAVFGWGESVAAAHAGAGEAARTAVALDDGDATAHTVLAIYEIFSGRHEEARRRLRRATDLDPNSALAHGYIGVSHAFAGETDAAMSDTDDAIRLSPRDPLLNIWYVVKGWAALAAERYEEAIEFTIRAAEAQSEFPDIYAVRAAAEGQLGRVDAGRSTLKELLRRMPALTIADERLNRPFARAGDRERFLAGLRQAGLPEA
jgi:TolB-like protein/class 3 adenylate cyclase/Flp pilus assembly protein TadD